jgi:hypothetical protein
MNHADEDFPVAALLVAPFIVPYHVAFRSGWGQAQDEGQGRRREGSCEDPRPSRALTVGA